MLIFLRKYRHFVIDKIRELHKEFTEFNSSEKAYLYAQIIWLNAIVITITLTPVLVKVLTGDTYLTGIVRMVYLWTMAAATISAGEILKIIPMRKMLIWSTILRGLLFGFIALLLFAGKLTFPIFLLIIAINAFIITHSHLLDLDMGGTNKIFSSAKKKEKALYLFSLMNYLALLVLPLLLSIFIDFLETALGASASIGLAFLLFFIMMLLSSYIYIKYLQPLGQAKEKKHFSLKIVSQAPVRLRRTALIVWQNKVLLLRFGMVAAELFIDDALLMVVLPTFALDILNSGIIGNGLLVAAMNAGGLIGAALMLTQAETLQRKYGFYPFAFWLGVAASCAFIPTMAFWLFPALWIAVPAVILMKSLYEPIKCRMDSMLQLEIASDRKAKAEEENIYSLLTLFDSICGGVAGLFFVWLFQNSLPGTPLHNLLGEYAPMKMVTLILVAYGILTLSGLLWLRGHVYHTYYSPYGVQDKNLKELELNLAIMGLPPKQIEIVSAELSQDRPTVAIMAAPTLDKLSVVREGGRQSPGDVHLVLDPSWILQELQPDNTNRLYLKKGIYFDREGDAVQAEYRHKRLIGYFANFFTPGAKSSINGVPLESKLDAPMSSSSKLEYLIKEKLLTRLWLAESGIPAITTLAFLMPDHPLLKGANRQAEKENAVRTIPFPSLSNPQFKELLTEQVSRFLESFKNHDWVVKPSGERFQASYGVKFFNSDQLQEMVTHIIELSIDPLMTPRGAVLIEERLHPPPLFIRIGDDDHSGRYCFIENQVPLHILAPEELPNAGESEKKDWMLHILIARAPWNKGVNADIIARMDTWGKPLSKQAAVLPFEDITAALRQQYKLLLSEEDKWKFEQELSSLGDRILKVIERRSKEYPSLPDDPLQAQTDFIGLDVMVDIQDGKLTPKIIAINDHNVGLQYRFDQIYPEQTGEHSRAWVATMLARARRNILRGKRLVLVSSGYAAKKFYFDKAREYGLHIILIDAENSWAKNLVPEFIPVDFNNHDQALRLAYDGLQRSMNSFGPIDGITTYWENEIILTAEIARDLNLFYHSVEAARTTRSKLKTRKILKSERLPVPLFFFIANQHALDRALTQITRNQHATGISAFPMFLKPIFGASSQYSAKVYDADHLLDVYAKIAAEIPRSADTVYKQGFDFILEEFLEGNEWDVDMVVQQGKVKFVSIADNWGETEPNYLPPCDSLPSYRLTPEAQQASIQLASNAVAAIGLTDGIFHAEGKYDPKKGPQILEVNARPGGAYLAQWPLEVWGVDLVEMFFYTALRIPISVYKADIPLTHLEGIVWLPDKAGVFMGVDGTEKLHECPGFREFGIMHEIGKKVAPPPETADYLAYLISEGPDKETALKNALHMRSLLRIIIQ